MINIYDDINRLEGNFRQMEEFNVLSQAVAAVKEDEEAMNLFRNFRDVQMLLMQKQQAGEDLQEDELEQAQKAASLAQNNVKILQMLEAEMALSNVLQEVNRILTKPIQDLYDGI